MMGEISATLLEVAPSHVHMGPWQLHPGSLVLSRHWKGNGQIPGQGQRVHFSPP